MLAAATSSCDLGLLFIPLLLAQTPERQTYPLKAAQARNTKKKIKELDAKVCVRNLHTAHFLTAGRHFPLTDRQLPQRSLICTMADR